MRERGPVRGLILRVGHLLHSVPELEYYADFLEQQGFESRESLANLTDELAIEFNIPAKLASCLREEVSKKRLKQRYTGPVLPLQDIEARDAVSVPRLHECEITPKARALITSKDPKSPVCYQVLRVGHRLHPPWELKKYAQILEDHDYSTRESLGTLTDQAAAQMRVPLKLAAALRAKAAQERREGGTCMSMSATSFEQSQERGQPKGVPLGPVSRLRSDGGSPRNRSDTDGVPEIFTSLKSPRSPRKETSNGIHSSSSPAISSRHTLAPGTIAQQQMPTLMSQAFVPQQLVSSGVRPMYGGMMPIQSMSSPRLQTMASPYPGAYSPPVMAPASNALASARLRL